MVSFDIPSKVDREGIEEEAKAHVYRRGIVSPP